ncbi:hypothetical protein SAMN05444004_11077 [Jannaschia faecimaris]|uniref:VOC domain-containing protein n=1 Tax=Jannaschia faecimaris TaxID=1244108 RepID=A0A1H3S1Y8_9RHOB|nr:VOC family protein [Jannaschia faecimaris]SDZ31860.1 hypothetical protein SAMN05444004_11077 [Jannaschia faecimaris]
MSLPQNAVVWTELPVTDLDRSRAFYGAVLKDELTIEEGAPNPIWNLPCADPKTAVAGHIYEGKPAPKETGPTVHLAVSGGLDDAMERVRANGGDVVSGVITIPAGRFFFGHDPDGNSIGFFES